MSDNIKTLIKVCPNCGEVFVPSKTHEKNGWNSLMNTLSKLNIDGLSGDEFFTRSLYCSRECRIEHDGPSKKEQEEQKREE